MIIDDVSLLAGISLGLACWVIYLQTKLNKLEMYTTMSAMFMRDLADGKATITRKEDGTITIKKEKTNET